MIKYFSTGYFSKYLLVLIGGAILWLPSLLFPNVYSGAVSFAYDHIFEFIYHNNFVLTSISFLLTIGTAIFLNKFAIDNQFVSKVSTLILVLYILFTSIFTKEIHNNPIIWVNFLLVFVWANLMQLPYVKNTIPIVFNASFLLGVASLFYSPLVAMFVLIWISIIIHRVVTWRNLLVTIIGVLFPYFFLMSLFYAMGNLFDESYLLFNSLSLDLAPVFPTKPLDIAILTIVISITVVSIIGVVGRLNEKGINHRRNLLITIVYYVIAFIILLVFMKSLVSILLLSIPMVLLLGNWLSNVKQTRWYNVILVMLTVLIILNQYLQLFIDIIGS